MPIIIASSLALLLPNTAAAEPNRNTLITSIDCEWVRLLTIDERQYWIRWLSLTAAEVRAIKRRCNIS